MRAADGHTAEIARGMRGEKGACFHRPPLAPPSQELITLDSDGASAASAKMHARTTAKATAKMGSAVMSQVSSRLGMGMGVLGRRINQQLAESLGSAADGAVSHLRAPLARAHTHPREPSTGSPSPRPGTSAHTPRPSRAQPAHTRASHPSGPLPSPRLP